MKIKIIVAVFIILSVFLLLFSSTTRQRYTGFLSSAFSGLFSLFGGSGGSFPVNVTMASSSFSVRSIQLRDSTLSFQGICDTVFNFGVERPPVTGQNCTIKVNNFDGRVDFSSIRASVSGRALKASLNEKNYLPRQKSQITFSVLND